MESLRARDMRVEQEVARFLNQYLYPRICLHWERFSGRQDQLHGKDLMIRFSGLPDLIVDEKAATQYINEDIKTFAFEIGFLRGDEHTPGWLIDESKETDCYLCIWIKASERWNLTSDDILELDCIFVSRKAILAYLASIGLDDDHLRGIEEHCRTDGTPGPHMKELYEAEQVYFYLTSVLAERPFNILLYRNLLQELAFRRFIVTKESVRQLKPLQAKSVEGRA